MAGWSLADIPDLRGRRAIVTGATGGIGLEVAAALALAGTNVVLTGRDPGRGAAAVATIRARGPAAQVSFAIADQANLASIAAFAAGVAAEGKPLDLLVNNAGVMGLADRQRTADGFEMQFGTNHLGHFALTAQLVPALLRAVAPRVVTVASLAHRRGRINFADLQAERGYRPYGAYTQAKLANLLFALEFARRLLAAGSPMASIAAHPGFARTGLFTASLRSRLLIGIGGILAQSAAAGALPLLYAATAPAARNGGYYGPDGPGEMKGQPAEATIAAPARNPATAERLWSASEHLTGIRFPPLA